LKAHKKPKIILYLIFGFFISYMILWAAGGFLIAADPLIKSDAIVVLSGGEGTRIEQAATWMTEGYGNYLILTETGIGSENPQSGLSARMMQAAVQAGVTQDAILVTAGDATSTYEEALAVRNLLEARKLSSCIVVTDSFHTQRTRLIFRTAFKGSNLSVSVQPVRSHWYQSASWMFSLDGWKYTLTEYLKMASFLLGFGEN